MASTIWIQNSILIPTISYDPDSQTNWIINHILHFQSEDGIFSTRMISLALCGVCGFIEMMLF